MRFIYPVHLFAAAGLWSVLTACTQAWENEGLAAQGAVIEVVGTIGDGQTAETKAALRPGGHKDYDPLSYDRFEDKDAIGLYAAKGLSADNAQLTLTNGTFSNADFHWGSEYAENLFAYYPYHADAATGMPLFRTSKVPGKDEIAEPAFEQVEDRLIASKGEAANGVPISLGFKHAFSMLIILRGEGFELTDRNSGANETVQVAMSAAVNGVKVGETADARCLELIDNLGGVTPQSVFTATKGTYTSGNTSSDAWFVIVPAGQINGQSIAVRSITLTNSKGKTETVVPDQPIVPVSNFKYPLTVLKEGVRPSIRPHEIRRWTDQAIVLNKPAGIYSAEDFHSWYTAYNTTPRTENEKQLLLKFGDRGSDSRWTFYLRADLSMTELESVQGYSPLSKVINELDGDVFDGCGYTITGLTLSNNEASGATGFAALIKNEGTIRNLTLHDLLIKGNGNTGGLAAQCENGTLENCRITGSSSISTGSDGAAGGLIGIMTDGTLHDCHTSALVIGGKANERGLLTGTRGPLVRVSECSSDGALIQLTH